MIPRFTDYAANERTYLAWVRTAIAIMAFGFLVERFDLFLAYLGRYALAAAANAGGAPVTAAHHLHGAQIAGLLLIGLAILIIMFATVRFLHHRKSIACEEQVDYGTTLGDSLLAIMLMLFAAFLVVYIIHQLMTLG